MTGSFQSLKSSQSSFFVANIQHFLNSDGKISKSNPIYPAYNITFPNLFPFSSKIPNPTAEDYWQKNSNDYTTQHSQILINCVNEPSKSTCNLQIAQLCYGISDREITQNCGIYTIYHIYGKCSLTLAFFCLNFSFKQISQNSQSMQTSLNSVKKAWLRNVHLVQFLEGCQQNVYSGGSTPSDKVGGGWSSRPWDKGRGPSQKKFFETGGGGHIPPLDLPLV